MKTDPTPQKPKFRRLRSLQHNVAEMKRRNMDAGQLPAIGRQWRIWWHILANLREVEGSWYGALRRYLGFFKT